MSYQATVASIMIASPGDVSEERQIAREVIHEWNYINSVSTKVVIMPVGWETHASPELSGRPQELINERILKGCDLLVGIFWTRLGTPTGKSASGTVEEIERHVTAGKPAMVYFSTAPVVPHNLDQEQFQAVIDFRRWCNQRGLTQEFENLIDFRQKFSRELQIALKNNQYLRDLFQSEERPVVSAPSIVGSRQIDDPLPYPLSKEAIALLDAASRDKSGMIMSVRYIGGHSIQASGMKFGDSADRRSMSLWEHALEQLIEHGLVIARGHKGEVFEVTKSGYDLAEKLRGGTAS